MPQARLRLLQEMFTGLVGRPEPGALVVGCTDAEVIYLVHVLTRMDEDSTIDRFLLVADPFADISTYVDSLELQADSPAMGLDTGRNEPLHRLHAVFSRLVRDLPAGDHRIVVALVPIEIADRPAFSALAESLMSASHDPRLRLIIRDDRLAPRHLQTAASDQSDRLFAYIFTLPPELLLAAAAASAHDPGSPPDDRALALIQLASLDLGHGRFADALARCEAVGRLPAAPVLRAFALALAADILRHAGDLEAAITSGTLALQAAVDIGALPVVLHAAMALGELTRDLGRRAEAAVCFELAERAAFPNPEAHARARALRTAVSEVPC